jgi:hypothetical protein
MTSHPFAHGAPWSAVARAAVRSGAPRPRHCPRARFARELRRARMAPLPALRVVSCADEEPEADRRQRLEGEADRVVAQWLGAEAG